MEHVNRLTSGQSQLPSQVTSTQSRDGEEAFHDLAKSKGNTKEDIAAATAERTRLTRVKRANKSTKKSFSSLFLVEDEDLEEVPIYYTVMDPTTGQIIYLKLLAVA